MKLFNKKKINYVDEMLRISYERLNTTEDLQERTAIMTDIYRLEELKAMKNKGRISASEWLTAGVSLLSLILVLKHEEANVITTKMWNKLKF